LGVEGWGEDEPKDHRRAPQETPPRAQLGQQQVAEATGYTWLSVSNWERGVNRPTKKAMIPIIAFLGDDPRAGKQEVNT
jgi:hypothetical protein